MIVKKPSNKYEKQIYMIIKSDKFEGMSKGERAILYDLATQYIPRDAYINFKSIDLDDYVNRVKIIYDKYKNSPIVNLVNMFIVKNNTICVQKTNIGGKDNASKNITSQQRYWFREFN